MKVIYLIKNVILFCSQLLKDVLQPKDMEDKSVIEIQTLKDKLAETTKEVQNLHTKFTQVMN